jgi:ketosteroid isomerase-like protein
MKRTWSGILAALIITLGLIFVETASAQFQVQNTLTGTDDFAQATTQAAPQANPSVPPANPTQQPTSPSGSGFVRWNHAWQAKDMDAFLALYAEDAVLNLPSSQSVPYGGTHQGREEIRRVHEVNWSAERMAPISPDEFEIIVKGDVITVAGERQAYLPNGEVMQLRCVMVFYTRENLVTRQDVFYDTLDFCKKMEIPIK